MNKLLLFILFLVGLISCRKERDETYPHVNIIQPGNLTTHHVMQPISFKVTASDETQLEKVTVYLLNHAYINVTSPVTFSCDENEETITGTITADDIHLESGTYFIKAVASDGFNDKVAYREIYLSEVPLELKNEIIITYNGSSLITLDSLSNNTCLPFHSLNTDFNGFLSDSWNQSFVFAGSLTGSLTVQESNSYYNRFSVSNFGSGTEPFFCFLHSYHNKFFVSDRAGKIKSYQKSGQPFDVIDLGNYYSESFFVAGDYLYSSSVFSTGSARSIQKFYIPTGNLEQSVSSDVEIRKIFGLGSGMYAVFGNTGTTGKIKIYHENNNSLTEPMIFSGSFIYDVCEQSNGIFLVATENGIYQVNLLNNTETNVITVLPVHHIKIEIISENIYFSSGHSLSVFDANFNLILNSTASDSIAEIDFLYNK